MNTTDTKEPYWVECWDMGGREVLAHDCLSLSGAVEIARRESARFEMIRIINPQGGVEYSPETIQEAFTKHLANTAARPKPKFRTVLRVIK